MQPQDVTPTNHPPFYLQPGVVDPDNAGQGFFKLCVSVNPATKIELHRLAISEGVTFWGSAAALILDYLAHNSTPLVFPAIAPTFLGCGGNRRAPGMNKSFKINVPVSSAAFGFLLRMAKPKHRAASVADVAQLAAEILHSNTPHLSALVRAARRWSALESTQ